MASMNVDMRPLWVYFLVCLVLVTIPAGLFRSWETQELLLKVVIFLLGIGVMYQFRTWSMGRYLPQKW
jgi:hypothetical protein